MSEATIKVRVLAMKPTDLSSNPGVRKLLNLFESLFTHS